MRENAVGRAHSGHSVAVAGGSSVELRVKRVWSTAPYWAC